MQTWVWYLCQIRGSIWFPFTSLQCNSTYFDCSLLHHNSPSIDFFLSKFAKFIYLFLFTLCSASWIVVDGCQSVSFTQCFLYRICSQISINLWPWSDLCLYSVTLDIFLQKFELWAFKKSIWNVFWVFTVLKYLEKQKKIKLTNQQIRLFLKQQ